MGKWTARPLTCKKQLSETSVLAKELNYAVTPKEGPKDDFIVATEVACKALPATEACQLCAEVAGILKSAKLPPPPNITTDERKALETLKKEKDVMFLPADKGKATVIIDTDKYIEQEEVMLSDSYIHEAG